MSIQNYLLFSKTTSTNGRRPEIEDGGFAGIQKRAEEEGFDIENYDCLMEAIKSFPQQS